MKSIFALSPASWQQLWQKYKQEQWLAKAFILYTAGVDTKRTQWLMGHQPINGPVVWLQHRGEVLLIARIHLCNWRSVSTIMLVFLWPNSTVCMLIFFCQVIKPLHFTPVPNHCLLSVYLLLFDLILFCYLVCQLVVNVPECILTF